ncbi:MAG: LON peptidase substrate-binding domain-containing protein [Myxococcales bacterium]|nr:LON peptidase substrate-binding domain-containing protein [Myxococcales bacterium]
MSDDCPHKLRERERERRAHVEKSLPRVALFPLPGAVLLPGCPMPLHIFEPRYRKMIADCLANGRVLAIGKLDGRGAGPEVVHERPPVHPTVGVGIIDVHQQLPDGRSIILLGGVLRAEIVSEHDGDLPYRTVQARAICDCVPRERRQEVETRVETLRHLVSQLATALPDSGAPELADLCRRMHSGRLADVVAGAVVLDPDERQRVLEEGSVPERLELVTDALADLLVKVRDDVDPRTLN